MNIIHIIILVVIGIYGILALIGLANNEYEYKHDINTWVEKFQKLGIAVKGGRQAEKIEVTNYLPYGFRYEKCIGFIDIGQSPITWVCVISYWSGYEETDLMYSLLFGIYDHRPLPNIRIANVELRYPPLLGVISKQPESDNAGSDLCQKLNEDEEMTSSLLRINEGIIIETSFDHNHWLIRKHDISKSLWDLIEIIAKRLLIIPLRSI